VKLNMSVTKIIEDGIIRVHIVTPVSANVSTTVSVCIVVIGNRDIPIAKLYTGWLYIVSFPRSAWICAAGCYTNSST
jgi:hypothetical protein